MVPTRREPRREIVKEGRSDLVVKSKKSGRYLEREGVQKLLQGYNAMIEENCAFQGTTLAKKGEKMLSRENVPRV